MNEVTIHLLLIATGIFAGFYAGNIGGGGLIALPVLIFLGMPTAQAIATQRFAALVLEVTSSFIFFRRGFFDKKLLPQLLLFGVAITAGSLVGTHITLSIDAHILDLIASLLLIAVALLTLFRKEKTSAHALVLGKKRLIVTTIAAFFLGIYGGFFGPGFGILITMLYLLSGFSTMHSSALARVSGFFMSAPSALIFAHQGFINYAEGISLGIGFSIGAYLGITFAIKKGEGFVKILMVIVLIATVIKLLLA